jgi:hypothetical protein
MKEPSEDLKVMAAAINALPTPSMVDAEPKVDEEALPVDPVLQAHLTRQANWEKDAEEIFRGPNEEQKRKTAHLDAMEQMNAANAEFRNAAEAETRKREKKARAEALIAEAKAARDKAKELDAEARSLLKAAE